MTENLDHVWMADQVAAIWNLTGSNIRTRNRHLDVAEARHAWWWVLLKLGLPVSKIAQVSGWDHSSIAYGIKRIERLMTQEEPPRWAVPVMVLSNPDVLDMVRASLWTWADRDQEAVLGYVSTDILYRPAKLKNTIQNRLIGLRLLLQYPALRQTVEKAFNQADYPNPTTSILAHARKLGYPVVLNTPVLKGA